MTAILDHIVDALRQELQQYGEILALIESHDGALVSSPLLASEIVAAQAAQAERKTRQRQLARTFERPVDSSFCDLIPLLPESYRPLASALARENRQLLRGIQELTELNYHLPLGSLDPIPQLVDNLSSPDTSALIGEETDSFAADSDGSSHSAAAG